MKKNLNLELSLSGVSDNELEEIYPKGAEYLQKLFDNSIEQGRWTGWIEQPRNLLLSEEYLRLRRIARDLREQEVEFLLVIAIGGSYTGTRALLEILQATRPKIQGCEVIFVGKSLSTLEISAIKRRLYNHSFAINVISKSGSTIEIITTFEIFRNLLLQTRSREEVKRLIIVTSDSKDGVLVKLAVEEGYQYLTIPREVGGRFSALTPVGIFPLEVAGFDTRDLLIGACEGYQNLFNSPDLNNPALVYALIRKILSKRYVGEMLVVYEPVLTMFNEWWKQIFAESEGKKEGALLPISAVFSTDLHSMGQYIQEGPKLFFQTTLWIEDVGFNCTMPEFKEQLKGYSFLDKKPLHLLNQTIFKASLSAHNLEAGLPQIVITLNDLSQETLGQLFAFFHVSCAVSALLLGVNPFDQPGVEIYKRKMLELLK